VHCCASGPDVGFDANETVWVCFVALFLGCLVTCVGGIGRLTGDMKPSVARQRVCRIQSASVMSFGTGNAIPKSASLGIPSVMLWSW
jgi:hypothetical protein